MAHVEPPHFEPPHQDLCCLQNQLYASLVLKEVRYSHSYSPVARCTPYDEMLRNFGANGIYLYFNPLYTGGLFHCYTLDESICHFRGVGSFCRFYSIFMENPISKNVDPNQMPHYVASDLGLHCLPMTLSQVSRSEWVNSV